MRLKSLWSPVALAACLLASAAPAQAYEVQAGKILDGAGQAIQLRGVNWFGFGTGTKVVHGLWTRNWKDMITQMQEVGVNAVRLPFCPATLDGVTPNGIDYSRNADLQGLNSLEMMDRVVGELSARGMYVLLDHHTPDCENISELWYTPSYSEQEWISDLAFVAQRYASVPGVIGLDIKNEPHGAATWGTGNPATDWNSAAERAAAAVLQAAPHWLIAVEGIGGSATCSSQNNAHFWGGNIEPLECTPLNIPANRLLLAPHTYGPDVYEQQYFKAPDFPRNMPAIWEQQFGRFVQKGYTIVLGEFGGKYGQGLPHDRAWQDALVDYLVAKDMRSGFYWSWNPNSGDTGGILNDDWQTLRSDKVQLLKRLWGDGTAPNPGPGPGPNPNPNPTPTPVPTPTPSPNFAVMQTVTSDWNSGYCQNVKIINMGSAAGDWAIGTTVSGTINNLWNAVWKQQGNQLTASGVSWNKTLAPGASAEFGFCAAR